MAYFEDITLDERFAMGAHRFAEGEIIDFATAHDPHPWHMDAARAKEGTLTASPWHIVAIWMKLMMVGNSARHKEYQERLKARGERPDILGPSPGFIDMSWPHPVYPGNEITYTSCAAEKVLLKSRPQWGIIRHRNEAVNAEGQLVMRFTGQVLCERRNPG